MTFKKDNQMRKGKISWNRGLTKDTDDRIKKYSEKIKGKTSHLKGRTYEEIFGKEKAKEKIEKFVKTAKRNGKLKKRYREGELIHPMKGKHHSESAKQKIREKAIGRISPCKGRKQLPEVVRKRVEQLKKIGFWKRGIAGKYLRTSSIKLKHRLTMIKNIETKKLNGLPLMPNIGKYENGILNNLEKCLTYKILRQYSINGYYLDGYCPALNLAIEVDEQHHFQNNELISKDVIRQEEIKQELNCKFLRIKTGDK